MIPARVFSPLIGLGLALLCALAGMWAGFEVARTDAAAQRTRAAEAALRELQAEQARGAQAVEAVQERLREQRRYESRLLQEIAHARLTVARPQPRVSAAAAAVQPDAAHCRGDGPGLVADAASAAGQPPGDAGAAPLGGAPGAADAQAPQPDDVGSGLELTLDAVRLWNSALTGLDVPAGACGAAAARGTACADGAGLGLEDAWVNHAVNAAACHRLRVRHDALVALLRQRQARRDTASQR